MKLPPYKTHHGEAAGHPGDSFGPPQLELYPGSVEQWRAYWFKYCPVRSMFDRQSLVTNWFAPAIPGAPTAAERYAQPVWKVHAHGDHKPTGQLEPPVDVVRIKAGDVYSREKLQKTAKDISDRLGAEGYAFANVNAVPEVDRPRCG